MENKATFYVGYSTFKGIGNGLFKEDVKVLEFVNDFIVKNGWDTVLKTSADSFCSLYEVVGDDKINKMKALLINNIESLLNRGMIPAFILYNCVKLNKLLTNEQIDFVGLNSNNSWYGVCPTPYLLKMFIKAPDTNKKYVYLFSDEDIPKYSIWLNSILYYNAMTNKTYTNTIRRIFKFYGKECIWRFVHSLKASGDIESMSATVMANMIDIFDTSFRPDEESDEVKSLLVDTFTRGAELINDFIKTKDENHLNTELKKLMQDTYKRYASLEDGSTDQQHDSSPEPESEKTIDSDVVAETPQIEYDNEFNSVPEYDDLKAYEAYIKQQQRDIIDQYIKRKEEKAKMENTIDTVATVDSNGKVMYVAKEPPKTEKASQGLCLKDLILNDDPFIWTKDPNTGKKGFTLFNYDGISSLYKQSKKAYYMVANAITDMVHSNAMRLYLSYDPNPIFTLSKLSDLHNGEMIFFTPMRDYIIRAKYDFTTNKYSYKVEEVQEGGEVL